MNSEFDRTLVLFPIGVLTLLAINFYSSLSVTEKFLAISVFTIGLVALFLWFLETQTTKAKDRKKRFEILNGLPPALLIQSDCKVYVGEEIDLETSIYLPDDVRTRHVHIIGSTGSGKTESVILNFIRQDIARGLGTIILDAKGDFSFLTDLKSSVPEDRLIVFDLSDESSASYNPLSSGTPLEASQRLFSSFVWSEEYYRSKALSALQRLFQAHFSLNNQNPSLADLADYLETPKKYAAFVTSPEFPKDLALKEFEELSGLRDQVRSLSLGHLSKLLSPTQSEIDIASAKNGKVIYFRLQSLISPQIVGSVGRLVINNLNFLAGTAHRGPVEESAQQRKLVPVYLDEFASFACAEFADLISKARSAGFALHFSHQSIGDLTEVSPGFLNRITDNAATKIVLRISDPDSAEFFARSFGTKQVQKTTQRITNSKEIEDAEILGEGTTRDAHQFRASPDLLKTHPTGCGSVLIAHGRDSPDGASCVLKIRFPFQSST